MVYGMVIEVTKPTACKGIRPIGQFHYISSFSVASVFIILG